MTRPLAAFALALSAAASSAALIHPPTALASVVQPGAGEGFVLFAQGERGATMSGSTQDLGRARAARTGAEPLLYVRQGAAAYVIRNADTLRRAAAIFAPQTALGDRQAALGEQQAALGARQAALGAQQARLGLRQAGASRSADADLEARQAVLGRQQEELGRQQDALGQQQSLLGRQQERLAREGEAQLRALVREAMRRGLARRVD